MALDRQGQLAGVTGQGGRLFYQDGSEWNEVQGVSSMAIAPDTAQTQTQTGFEGSVSFPGSPEIGAVTFETASIMPLHRSWKFLAAAQRAGDSVLLRFETRKREITAGAASGETAAIAATGVVTLAGITVADLAAAGVARGMVLVASGSGSAPDDTDTSQMFVIQSMTDTTITVTTLAGAAPSAVSAGRFSVIIPIFRWNIPGTVTSAPKGDIGVESPITGSLVVQPRTSLADPEAVGDHSGE